MSDGLLTGHRVLDLTDLRGMFCGKLFADLGADVVKVEPPGGDAVRRLGPFYHDEADPEKSLLWLALNTSKRGVTLDITSRQGQQLFLKLVEHADFVFESFAPGYLDEIGLGYRTLGEVNPGLILTSITPFGQDGPYRDYRATDFTLMAMGGLTYTCGDEDRPPVSISLEPQAYYHGCCAGAIASLAAHWQRQAIGEGQHVDVSIYEALLYTPMFALPRWEATRQRYRRTGNRQQRTSASYRIIFPCKDGYVSARMGFGPTFGAWGRRLAEAMAAEGIGEELTAVPWERLSFDDNPQDRVYHWEALMLQFFARHTKQEILELGVQRQIALSPVNTIPELLAHEQLAARRYWVELEHPELGTKLPYPGPFLRAAGLDSGPRAPAPRIGQHNEDVFCGELGLSAAELAGLRERRVV